MESYDKEREGQRHLLETIGNTASSHVKSLLSEEGFKMLYKNKKISITLTLSVSQFSSKEYGFDGSCKIDSKETAKELVEYVSVDDQLDLGI